MSSKKKKASPKKSSMSRAELQSSVSAVRGQLTKTEAKLAKAKDKTERWKKEATAQRKAAAESGQRVKELQQKLEGAETAGQRTRVARPGKAAASKRPPAKPRTAGTGSVPDKGWTVVQLRAEARARGLVGVSNTPKAHLLAALS